MRVSAVRFCRWPFVQLTASSSRSGAPRSPRLPSARRADSRAGADQALSYPWRLASRPFAAVRPRSRLWRDVATTCRGWPAASSQLSAARQSRRCWAAKEDDMARRLALFASLFFVALTSGGAFVVYLIYNPATMSPSFYVETMQHGIRVLIPLAVVLNLVCSSLSPQPSLLDATG